MENKEEEKKQEQENEIKKNQMCKWFASGLPCP